MSVLIKGMKMPRLCRECACVQPSFSGTGYFCAADEFLVRDVNLNDVPPDWCPLIEVPIPHGRLVDADNLVQVIDDEFEEVTRTFQNPIELFRKSLLCGFARDVITAAPTIIEAEEGEEDEIDRR